MVKKEKKSNDENRFEKEQPLRHPLIKVAIDEEDKKIKIGEQVYRILINKSEALDVELLRKKYDPYLNQYDFLVGDISSDHLRLKGFFKDAVRTSIDKKKRAIADYLTEYCNPGSAYFVLELLVPVHHYKVDPHRRERNKNYRRKNNHNKSNNFKKRRVHATKFKRRKTIAVKKENSRRHSFVIKKKKEKRAEK